MSHRAHLFSLRICHALREACFGSERYSLSRFQRDVLAGATVGIIAIPLAMALAIASGVAPQYGLYTAIIGGFVIALTGGSRFSISGPTAAFVVILYPIAQRYGLAGLLLATILAGLILIAMAYARLGRFIEYIPESVTLGFTGGIAIVIATLQLKDLFGLSLQELPEHYVDKVWLLFNSLGGFDSASVFVALVTLGILLYWPKLKTAIPPHLPAVVIAGLVGVFLANRGFDVDTIASRFTYFMSDGSTGLGIPPYLPDFAWPWQQPGPGGQPFEFTWSLAVSLLPSAFAIAMLGAIESLLCAVVLDGMTGKRHSANSELLGQGLGNIIAPFFGGITATAAIARSAANLKAGAESPVAAMIHALVVLLGLVVLAPLLAYLPMPAMAALLIVVAWNMSEAPKSLHLVKHAPAADIAVFVTCLLLTVFFDMVIAITAGVLLACILFVNEMASMTRVTDISGNKKLVDVALPDRWAVLKINGPLFFAAADRAFGEISASMAALDGVILYMDGVTLLDAGGVAAMNKLVTYCAREGKQLVIADLQFQPLKTLARAKVEAIPGVTSFYPTLNDAIHHFS
ncbi:MAG: C4-dicarboxylic acid transporter DauA [Pseudomonadales bacterium]|nr:C4-dicarboxylic acid transporter DauA [Halioglobus sp.]MCP5194593.1 C4-dicarboxylic acid transporter DauA [Pseudomonadales bacterium]